MDYSLGPFSDRTERLLTQLEQTLEVAHSHTKHLPTELWHYTSADGIRAIIDTGRIRLSHARFLNDPTEVVFGWDVVRDALDAAIAAATNLKPFFEMTREVAGDVYHKTHYFTFCLSARPDSLSQWRAYGGGGEGYSLGFDSGRILTTTEPDVTCVLARMRYADEDRKALLQLGLNAAKKFFAKLLRDEVAQPERLGIAHRANVLLSKFMMVAALSFKNPSFEDEQEWRLVAGLHRDEPSAEPLLREVAFRSGASIVKPYLDLPLKPETKRLPIAKIMFGPTLRPALTQESLEFFLARRGYSDVPVEKSNVPLQA